MGSGGQSDATSAAHDAGKVSARAVANRQSVDIEADCAGAADGPNRIIADKIQDTVVGNIRVCAQSTTCDEGRARIDIDGVRVERTSGEIDRAAKNVQRAGEGVCAGQGESARAVALC